MRTPSKARLRPPLPEAHRPRVAHVGNVLRAKGTRRPSLSVPVSRCYRCSRVRNPNPPFGAMRSWG
jgi:hypothetical protein